MHTHEKKFFLFITILSVFNRLWSLSEISLSVAPFPPPLDTHFPPVGVAAVAAKGASNPSGGQGGGDGEREREGWDRGRWRRWPLLPIEVRCRSRLHPRQPNSIGRFCWGLAAGESRTIPIASRIRPPGDVHERRVGDSCCCFILPVDDCFDYFIVNLMNPSPNLDSWIQNFRQLCQIRLGYKCDVLIILGGGYNLLYFRFMTLVFLIWMWSE